MENLHLENFSLEEVEVETFELVDITKNALQDGNVEAAGSTSCCSSCSTSSCSSTSDSDSDSTLAKA